MAASAIVTPATPSPAPVESRDLVSEDPGVEAREELGARERLWTWDALLRAYDLGFLPREEAYELLEGRLFRKMPQKNAHLTTIAYLARALHAIFGPDAAIYSQSPLNGSPTTHPEPDVAVLPGTLEDWDGVDAGPSDVLLAIEVSDTTLASDRGYKAPLYARLGIAELWIVDLGARRIEVRQGPLGDGGWSLVRTVGEGESVVVPGSEATLRVADVLPRVAPEPPAASPEPSAASVEG